MEVFYLRYIFSYNYSNKNYTLSNSFRKVGGFSLPFFVTGGIAIVIAFVNMYVLPPPKSKYLLHEQLCILCSTIFFLEDDIERGGSLLSLLRLPPVFLTCLITVVMAMSASYLDPTLEPHLRKSVS